MKVDSTYLNDLLIKLIIINNKVYANSNDKDGDIGERFVKDGIKYYMWEKGFKLRNSGNRTFSIGKPPKKGKGGVDFPFSFTHNSVVYDCYIEAKNWDVYHYISNSWFNLEILNRFIQNVQPKYKRIVTMNFANISLINQRCQQNNIHILALDMKITSTQLNTTSLTLIMEHFLDEINKLMTTLTGIKFRRPKKRAYTGSCDEAIILGLPSKLIAIMYGTTANYVDKRRSELKRQGVDILDMNSRTARLARLLIKKNIEKKILLDIIRYMLENENRE